MWGHWRFSWSDIVAFKNLKRDIYSSRLFFLIIYLTFSMDHIKRCIRHGICIWYFGFQYSQLLRLLTLPRHAVVLHWWEKKTIVIIMYVCMFTWQLRLIRSHLNSQKVIIHNITTTNYVFHWPWQYQKTWLEKFENQISLYHWILLTLKNLGE